MGPFLVILLVAIGLLLVSMFKVFREYERGVVLCWVGFGVLKVRD